MAKIFIVDEQGASSVSLQDDARARFDEANIAAFGASLDTASHAPQNQIAGINALVWTEIGEDILRSALWGASPSYAEGIYLDSLGGLLDIRRQQAAKTRVNAVLTGTAGANVPAGSLARTDRGDQFELDADVVIQAGGSIGSFSAVETGPIECAAGELSNIVSVLAGWTGVSNESGGTPGRAKESDASYRANILALTAQSSIGSISALRSAMTSAGATTTRVVENATGSPVTKNGVTIPRNSIFVLAEGGLDDDIARAVENHRGMGTGTYAAIIGRPTVLSAVQSIDNGLTRWNGSSLSGLNFSTDTLAQAAAELSAVSNAPSVISNDDRLIAFYQWDTDTTGFVDIGGSVAESVTAFETFRPIGAEYYTTGGSTSVRVRYSDAIASHGSFASAPTITYTDSSGSTQTLTTTGSTGSWAGINTIWWTLSNAIPSSATDAKITLNNTITNRTAETSDNSAALPLIEEELGAGSIPAPPQVYGEAVSTTEVEVWGWAFGSVTKWQRRRFQNGAYLDSDWVDIPSSAGRLGNGLSGVHITGFTAGLQGSRVDLRAVNSNGETRAVSVGFDTISTAPTIQRATIDGRSIVLTLDRDLLPSVRTSGLPGWSVNQSGVNVTEQRIRGKQVYLKTNNAVSSSANVTISYTGSGSYRVQSLSRVQMANFTNRAVTNNTIVGVPSAPAPVWLFKDGDGYRFTWIENDGGGQTIDRYEYSISRDNRNTWSAWAQLSSTLRTLSPDGDLPDAVRVRASTPNARTAEILGFSGIDPVPFMRPLERALSIELIIGAASSLSGNDLDAIRNALLDRVQLYEMGETLRIADLRSEVERLPGVIIDSFSVTSGGGAVDGATQNSYVRWTLDRSDINIQFA